MIAAEAGEDACHTNVTGAPDINIYFRFHNERDAIWQVTTRTNSMTCSPVYAFGAEYVVKLLLPLPQARRTEATEHCHSRRGRMIFSSPEWCAAC